MLDIISNILCKLGSGSGAFLLVPLVGPRGNTVGVDSLSLTGVADKDLDGMASWLSGS